MIVSSHIFFIGGVIAALFLAFLWKYLIPGWMFWFKLKINYGLGTFNIKHG